MKIVTNSIIRTNSSASSYSPVDNDKQVNQLEFLLSKASEYSNFIARDLEELQQDMANNARRVVMKAEKKEKKRKSEAGGKATGKKQKTSKTSSKALASAQEKDAKIRAGSRPIFVQPPNLAEGCTLKDYQLEGVRWLASLFENGVSGILADESKLTPIILPRILRRSKSHFPFLSFVS